MLNFATRERMAAGGISKMEGKIGGFSFKWWLVWWLLYHRTHSGANGVYEV